MTRVFDPALDGRRLIREDKIRHSPREHAGPMETDFHSPAGGSFVRMRWRSFRVSSLRAARRRAWRGRTFRWARGRTWRTYWSRRRTFRGKPCKWHAHWGRWAWRQSFCWNWHTLWRRPCRSCSWQRRPRDCGPSDRRSYCESAFGRGTHYPFIWQCGRPCWRRALDDCSRWCEPRCVGARERESRRSRPCGHRPSFQCCSLDRRSFWRRASLRRISSRRPSRAGAFL